MRKITLFAKKSIAVVLTVLICMSAISMGVSAINQDIPVFPDFTPADGTLGSILGVDIETNRVKVNTSTSGEEELAFYIEFPVSGGIRLYDANEETDGSDLFNTGSVLAMTAASEGTVTTMTATGIKAVLDGTNANWTLAVYKANSTTEVAYTLSASDLLFGYKNGERDAITLKGDVATDEYFIGLGERFDGVLLNGKTYPLWNEDCWSEDNKSYVNVPLLHSTKGYSVFFDNSYAGTADIGKTNSAEYSLSFAGPHFNIYFYTDTTLNNIKKYTALTGTPKSVPAWALSYWAGGQSKVWDKDTSVADKNQDTATLTNLQNVIAQYKTMGTLPSAVYLEGKAGASRTLLSYLQTEGVKGLNWNHPDMLVTSKEEVKGNDTWAKYYLANSTIKNDKTLWPFTRILDGTALKYDGEKDVDDYLQSDFTHTNITEYLKNRVRAVFNLDLDSGKNDLANFKNAVGGTMVDYGEYITADTLFANGKTGDEMHNLQAYYYAMAMEKAWNSLETDYVKNDTVQFARAGYAGSQKYAAQFAGDQPSTFEGLAQAINGGISISASGYSIWGSDIGGLGREMDNYADSWTPGENWWEWDKNTQWQGVKSDAYKLYQRWLQFGTFSPIMRLHGSAQHDPWVFDEANSEGNTVAVFQKYYWIRESLKNALYSSNLQSEKDGTPMMQAMALAYPELAQYADQYMFLNDLLVAPVYTDGATTRDIAFPTGKWYSIYDGSVVTGANTVQTVAAELDTIPVYLRSGSVLPLTVDKSNYMLSTAHGSNNTANTLLITPPEAKKTSTILSDNADETYTVNKESTGYSVKANAKSSYTTIVLYDTNITSLI